MKFTQFFVERAKLTNLILIFVIIAGVFAMSAIPRQDMPNVNFNIVTIVTFYQGASPEDVEVNVTDLIEDELEQVDGIEEMSSFSVESMSYIVVQLDPNTSDTMQIKDDIRSAVDRVTNLPKEVEDRPLVKEMRSTDFPVLEVAISADEGREDLLREIAKDMESEIKTIGKVGGVDKVGYRKKEVKILTDLNKMKENYVSFFEIIQAIRARNVKLSGGTLESYVDEKNIVTLAEFEELDDVKDVIIRSNFSGHSVKVSDVAQIKLDYEKKTVISRTNGINSINLVIKRRGSSDVIDLSHQIDSIVKKYQETYAKKGIKVVKVVDYTYYTKALLDIVTKNAFLGFLLVVAALFVFLNFRTAFWVAIGIPLCILGAYIFFPLFDVSTNQITLITIIMVLGMLVDDAIVIGENINRHQENGMDFKKAALVGTKEVIKPVVATILTTIICFVPIYFMTGILGKFVMTIPTIVILTLGMSLLESTTLLPCHLSRRKEIRDHKKQAITKKIQDWYGLVLCCFLQNRIITVVVFLAVGISVTLFYTHTSKLELFPTEDFDLFYIVMEQEEGVSLEEMSQKVKEVEHHVAKIPGDLMINYKTVVGEHRTDEAAADPAQHSNWGLITVFLHPASQRNVRSEKIIEKLQTELKDIKKDYVKFDVRELQDGPPMGAPITIRLVSDNTELSQDFEKKVWAYLNSIDGVINLETSNRQGKKEIGLKLDYQYMARVGITAMDVADAIRVAYDGHVATSVRRDGEEVDFRVLLKHNFRTDPDILKKIEILNNQNDLIALGQFTQFEIGQVDSTITHFDGKKAVVIKGDVNTDKVTAQEVSQMVRDKFESEIAQTPGITMVFGGEEKQTMESMQNFLMAFLCGMLGVYFILVILLNSYIQPFLIMIAIPFGLVGVMIAFYLHKLPISFMAMIGILGMIGVVVNDSLVMTTYLNELRDRHKRIDVDLIVEGAKTRFRPVLLTTVTTVLGLLPTVYGFWGGTEPFVVPMVLAMSWGLAFATFITLILIPVLYTFSGGVRSKGLLGLTRCE